MNQQTAMWQIRMNKFFLLGCHWAAQDEEVFTDSDTYTEILGKLLGQVSNKSWDDVEKESKEEGNDVLIGDHHENM